MIAQLVYDARTENGLSQAQLAKLVGTTQSVISRLEDSDYRGHSLMMLRRIAKALGKRLELRMVPERKAG
jgi:transcriptional regulator with XRE-family HTH domain